MKILEKNPNKVEVKIKINKYSKNFNFKLTCENKINMEMDNILNNYNSVETFAIETKESKWIYEE